MSAFGRRRTATRRVAGVLALAMAGAALAAVSAMASYGSWSQAVRVEDTPPGAHPDFNGTALDGCPLVSRDGLSFFMASTRTGGLGGIDIWVSTRASESDPWGAPVNVGAPINSPQNDFCPLLDRDGTTFYFVSNRPGGCGGVDMYVTRRHVNGVFKDPVNMGCELNSPANEASPVPNGKHFYFSSNKPGGYSPEPPDATAGDSDLYVATWDGTAYTSPVLVPGANSASEDGQPYARKDGRELFFFSNRPGTIGGNDIYTTTRPNINATWAEPVNLGPNVNSPASETRPSLSWDGRTLYFGSTRPGGEGDSDHYQSTR